jgi:hypothetical protein
MCGLQCYLDVTSNVNGRGRLLQFIYLNSSLPYHIQAALSIARVVFKLEVDNKVTKIFKNNEVITLASFL